MELIDLSKLKCNENLRWAICELMAGRVRDPDRIENIWPNKFDPECTEFLKWQVEMKIDGVEVKFSTILNLLMGQFEDQVKKEAVRYIEEKCNNLTIKLNDFVEEFKSEMGIE